MKTNNDKGFALIGKVLVLALIGLTLSAGWFVWGSQRKNIVKPNASLASNASIRVSGPQLLNASSQAIRLLGVDAAGTESSCIADTGISPAPLSHAEAAGMLAWHINAVRIPLNEDCWLGINGSPAAYSGVNYRNAIKNWVSIFK